MKGDQCGFLHQYDVEKMPICRNLLKHGECKELDCPYKHNTGARAQGMGMYNTAGGGVEKLGTLVDSLFRLTSKPLNQPENRFMLAHGAPAALRS